MKVGSRGDYGLRALIYLARKSFEGRTSPVQVHDIAAQQQIPEDYLRQLLVQLRLAGLIKSVRGPHGGYLLAKLPGAISMGEVLQALEGPPERMPCNHIDEGRERCRIVAACNMRERWGAATKEMEKVLFATTLEVLAAEPPIAPTVRQREMP